jgi:YD repeat-containing protein
MGRRGGHSTHHQHTASIASALNRLTRKTTPLGATQYAYDNVANLLTLTDPSGATSNYSHNAVNWVTQQDDRASGGALNVSYAFVYDANGNRTQETETRPGKPYRITDKIAVVYVTWAEMSSGHFTSNVQS